MTDLSRRTFLGGVLALTGAGFLRAPAVPALWGDGLHDDWAGLMALIHRRPVRIIGDGIVRVGPLGTIAAERGRFLFSRELDFRGADGFSFTGCRFETTPEFPPNGTMIRIFGEATSTVFAGQNLLSLRPAGLLRDPGGLQG